MFVLIDSFIDEVAGGTLRWEELFGSSEKTAHHLDGQVCCECASCCVTDIDHNTPSGTVNTDSSKSVGPSIASVPVFTLDQIANQLTSGYWPSVSGGSSRSFDVKPGGILNVDLSDLQPAGRILARQALDAWGDVTGISFIEIDAIPEPNIRIVETIDASTSIATEYSIDVGDEFSGTMSSGEDRDAVAVSLLAGQTYTISLRGDHSSGNATLDPYLRVFDYSGALVGINDDADSRDSRLTFTATHSGTYYIQAASYADSYAGDYTIRVVESAGDIHLTFGDQAPGAYAQSTTSGTTILSSFINVNHDWAGGGDRIDSYVYQTYLHEIGHALGLGHTGNYNGGATYGSDNHFANDSWSVSVMSYFHQTENTFSDASFAYTITPMMADILAIQELYGRTNLATGDDTYGRGGNRGTYLDDALYYETPTAWTIYDSGGTDHFDFSGFFEDQRLDLREETWSDVAGLVGNVAIARGTVIENGTTGLGNDHLIGNWADNALSAGLGADTAFGGAGQDAIVGGAGNDWLFGDEGRDLLEGGEGPDNLEGGSDGDLLIGDDVSLDDLLFLFPAWTPPEHASANMDAGELHLLWDSILSDVFAVA